MSLGTELRTARLARGETQEQVARQLGVSWPTVCRWENGKTEPTGLSRRAIMGYLKDSTRQGTEASDGK